MRLPKLFALLGGELRLDVTVSEHEAKLAGQVLRVVMPDLNPGR